MKNKQSNKVIKLLQEKIDLELKKKAIESIVTKKEGKPYKKYENPLKALNSQIESKEIEINKLLEE